MLVLPHVLLYHKSIRAQLSMTFRQNRALVMFGDTRNVVKSLACGSWFYNVLVSLPTSRVLYFADKVIESCALMLKYRNIKVCLSSDEAGARLKNSVAQTLPEIHISRVFSFFRVLFSFSRVFYVFRKLFPFYRLWSCFSAHCSCF